METPRTLRSRYEFELDRLISRIEAGGDWPAVGSDDNALLKRAMRKDPSDRKEWAVTRIAACRPDKVPRSREEGRARLEARVAKIEQGGAWPPLGSPMAVKLADYLSPKSPRFRKDICDRIGHLRPEKPAKRATRAQVAALVEEVVGKIERTGIFPRATSPGGRVVRAWIKPSDERFRPSVWQRLEACVPQVLDTKALEAERARIEAAVASIEAGGSWPPRRSAQGALIARALDVGGFFYREDLVARLKASAPHEFELAMRRRKGSAGSQTKKRGGHKDRPQTPDRSERVA